MRARPPECCDSCATRQGTPAALVRKQCTTDVGTAPLDRFEEEANIKGRSVALRILTVGCAVVKEDVVNAVNQ